MNSGCDAAEGSILTPLGEQLFSERRVIRAANWQEENHEARDLTDRKSLLALGALARSVKPKACVSMVHPSTQGFGQREFQKTAMVEDSLLDQVTAAAAAMQAKQKANELAKR